MDCIKDKAQATQNLTFEMAQSAKGIAHNKISGASHTTKDKMSRAAKATKDKALEQLRKLKKREPDNSTFQAQIKTSANIAQQQSYSKFYVTNISIKNCYNCLKMVSKLEITCLSTVSLQELFGES
ncbi:hypothetical protein KY284_036175 [Solanum tuberosum]|nr:hypothetical protein KY284_036175 [Solanum tuberosum]